MVKYSFIVPVYNTEKYLKRCLDSLVNQTYKGFEIIIVNDVSTDNSQIIIDEYINKYSNIYLVNQENQGLSEARNNGVKKVNGKYLIFVDSDDYVEKDLLKTVDNNIENVDILRYQIVTEDDNGNNKIEYKEESFNTTTGIEAFKKITKYHFVEPAWCYIYKKKYYLDNKFNFKKGIYHEDYALIPYVINKARTVKSINYLGYHYIIREGSIMNNNDYSKTIKKCFDMLEGYKYLKIFSSATNNNIDDYYLSYISNSVIVKAKELKKDDRKKYIEELKKLNAFDGVLADTISRKLKKALMKFNLNLYLKVIK